MHEYAMKNKSDSETRAQCVLACLAVPSRFRLVKAIAEANRCVGELAISVGLSQSCTTRHLQTLERAGLVRGHRDGRRVRFTLCMDADGPWDFLGLVLGGADPIVPVGSSTMPSGVAVIRPTNSLPDVKIGTGAKEVGSSGDGDNSAPRREFNAEGIPEPPQPARSFQRREIEDYLL
jgi:DNA-binding transcriptional ArsR family regulator